MSEYENKCQRYLRIKNKFKCKARHIYGQSQGHLYIIPLFFLSFFISFL